MIRIENVTPRKNIVKYQTQHYVEPKVIIQKPHELHKIISETEYTVSDETLLIVKDVDQCEILLNSQINQKIYIKSLTNVIVKSDVGSIDDDWDELLLEKGASVLFQFVEGNWYILSSDGMKFS
jgi:hypothetical protein